MSAVPLWVKNMVEQGDFDADALMRLVVENGGKVLDEPTVVGERRWSLRKRVVVSDDPLDQQLYGVEWSEGSTEYQGDTDPEPECYLVKPMPSIRYVRKG